ncbi:hypothetical protein UlMin_029373 [Ulmus minor]
MEGDLVKKSSLLDVFGGLSSHMKECVEVFGSKVKEVVGREEELDLREKRLEASEKKMKGEIEVGKKRLEEMGKKAMDLDLKVDSLESLVQHHEEVLEEKEKLFWEIKKRVAEKEKELADLESSVVDRGRRLELLEIGLKEIEANAKELIYVLGNLRSFGEELEIKKRQCGELQCVIDDRRKEVQVIEERLNYCHSSIEKCDREIVAKEDKLKSVQRSLLERSKELEMRHKEFSFALVSEVRTRKMNLDGCMKELELEKELVESSIEELNSIQKKCDEDIKELESKEGQFLLLQREVEASSRELELKDARYEKRVKEFKVRQKTFNSIRRLTRWRVREKTNALLSRVMNEPMEYSITTSDNVDGKYLLSMLSHHMETNIAINSHIYDVFEVASDPAKLVLDVVEEFYPLSSSREGEVNDLSISRASCIILLEKLMEAAPNVNPQVKEEAMKLAINWKDKLKVSSGNSLEVLGYMQFLASYRLAFQEDEIRSFLDFLGDEKHASKILEAFHIAVNAHVKGLQAESSMVMTLSSFINLQSGSITGGRNFDWFLNEDITKNVARQNDILAMVQKSSNPTKFILEIMEGSFSQHWRTGDLCLKVIVLKNCIFLLEKLSTSLSQIQPFVKEAAEKFAFWWKSKIRENTENYPLELFSFVQFLHIYQLTSSFRQCEILNFLCLFAKFRCISQFLNSYPMFQNYIYELKAFLVAMDLLKACIDWKMEQKNRGLVQRHSYDVS